MSLRTIATPPSAAHLAGTLHGPAVDLKPGQAVPTGASKAARMHIENRSIPTLTGKVMIGRDRNGNELAVVSPDSKNLYGSYDSYWWLMNESIPNPYRSGADEAYVLKLDAERTMVALLSSPTSDKQNGRLTSRIVSTVGFEPENFFENGDPLTFVPIPKEQLVTNNGKVVIVVRHRVTGESYQRYVDMPDGVLGVAALVLEQ